MKIYKAGSIELTEKELQQSVDAGECVIIGHRRAYAIAETCSGFQITEAYRTRASLPLMPRGRFHITTAKQANKVIGYPIFLQPVKETAIS